MIPHKIRFLMTIFKQEHLPINKNLFKRTVHPSKIMILNKYVIITAMNFILIFNVIIIRIN